MCVSTTNVGQRIKPSRFKNLFIRCPTFVVLTTATNLFIEFKYEVSRVGWSEYANSNTFWRICWTSYRQSNLRADPVDADILLQGWGY